MKRRYLVFGREEGHVFNAVMFVLMSRMIGFTAEYDGDDMHTIRFECSDNFFKLLKNRIDIRCNGYQIKEEES